MAKFTFFSLPSAIHRLHLFLFMMIIKITEKDDKKAQENAHVKSWFQYSCWQLYWNYTLAWGFSCKFAAYLQNTFLYKHLWRLLLKHLTHLPKFIQYYHELLFFFSSNLVFLKAHCQVWGNFLATEIPLKVMKNAFYFTLKVFSFSRYLNFSIAFWSYRKTAGLET